MRKKQDGASVYGTPSIALYFVFLLFLCVIQNVKSLLVYDHQTLLELRWFAGKLGQYHHEGQDSLPPFLSGIPAFLYRPPGPPHWRKRHRRRGKRGGRLVKLKVYLARSSRAFLTQSEPDPNFFASWRALDHVNSWLVPVVGPDQVIPPPRSYPLRLHRRGVNLQNLRPLARAPHTTAVLDPAPVRMGLVNARSVMNKTFIIKDFFTSHGLDFLCVTETWMSPGESSAFSELLPPDCLYFNSPRSSGCGGGLATVFKLNFECKQLSPSVSYSSFELSLFELGHSPALLCAVVYRPPKYDKDFLNYFSDLLAEIMPRYDQVLMVGDFNIHICCLEKPLVKDFLDLVESFNLIQSVNGPTQERGHTLDLVLSSGLSVLNLEVGDAVFSDHMPVLFDFVPLCQPAKNALLFGASVLLNLPPPFISLLFLTTK